MKKIILAAAALLISTGAFAQINWGVKAGLNLADVTNFDDSKFKPSIYAGVFAEFTISDFVGIQPEVIYSRQGSFEKDGDDKAWLRLNYINVPIVAKLYLLEGLSLDLGPQFGFMVADKIKIKEDGETHTGDTGADWKTFDFSVAMGLSYKITSNLDISARYNLGITKLIDVDSDKPKNSVIQVGLGYRF